MGDNWKRYPLPKNYENKDLINTLGKLNNLQSNNERFLFNYPQIYTLKYFFENNIFDFKNNFTVIEKLSTKIPDV